MSLADWLQHASLLHPHGQALVTSRERLDYQALSPRTGALLERLVADGLVPGEPLGVISRSARRIAWAAYLASWGGNRLLPLSPERPESDLKRLIHVAGIRQVLADDGLNDLFPDRVKKLPIGWLEAPLTGSGLPSRKVSPEEVQLLIATSGSARCVMLSGNNLLASVRASRKHLGLQPGDVWLVCLPLYHIGGFSILLRCAEAGATVLLHEGFNTDRILEDLDTQRVTHISLVPPMLSRLLGGGTRPPSCLRVTLVGGGPLSNELASRALNLGWPLCHTYGMSETASQVATRCSMEKSWSEGDVGPPLPGINVEIMDDSNRPTTGTGRIRVSGPVVMAGYANVKRNPDQGLSSGTFTSGDLGYFDKHGHLHIVGRADDVLVTGGRNIHSQEVESLLMACPGVEDVAVTAREDSVWGDYLVALFVGILDTTELDAWCRVNLPSALRPREFIRVEGLPRDGLGKLNRDVLRSWARKDYHSTSHRKGREGKHD